MNKTEKIIQMLEKQINNLSDFIQIENREAFEIMELDDDKQSYLIKNKVSDDWCELVSKEKLEVYNADKAFKVSNANCFTFIPIDGDKGLMTSIETERIRGGKTSRCDCVLFDERTFCFLEFKMKVKVDEPQKRAIKENFKNAVEQLKSTINKFNELLNQNYPELELEAYVATPPIYPKNSAFTRSIDREFLLNYPDVKLFETNEKIC